jgi:hypothetical protein
VTEFRIRERANGKVDEPGISQPEP